MSTDPSFNTEVFKLLLQVISSDHEISPAEVQHLSETAQALSVPTWELDAIAHYLRQGSPLPAPNMGLLRTQPQVALQAATALIASDQRLDEGEVLVLQQIAELLGVDPG
jgi:uncharacterized tellurite resistance protein B-like protein